MAVLGEDPRHRAEQLAGDVRRTRHLAVVPDKLGFAVAGAYENAAGADGAGQPDVSRLVADHERTPEVDVEALARLMHHAGLRLPAVAVEAQRVNRGFRMVGTVEPAVDPAAGRVYGRCHLLVHAAYECVRT